MKKAVAYCIKGINGQTKDDCYSVEDQLEQIERYAAAHDIEIIDLLLEDNDTIAVGKHPVLEHILLDKRTISAAECIIVAKTAYLANDIMIYYAYKEQLQRVGLEVLSVSVEWSSDDKQTAEILEKFLTVTATMESENLRIRTIGGRRQKAKVGGYSGGKPALGYRGLAGKLVIIPEEAEIVRFIFAQRQTTKNSNEIARRCTAAGHFKKNGKPFACRDVQNILGNERFYKGEYKYGGSDVDWVQGQHEPIL